MISVDTAELTCLGLETHWDTLQVPGLVPEMGQHDQATHGF